MDKQDQFRIDQIYKNMSLDEIPWNLETPPAILVELVDSGKVQPCRAIDLGCGAGGYFVIPAAQKVGENGIAYAVDIQEGVL